MHLVHGNGAVWKSNGTIVCDSVTDGDGRISGVSYRKSENRYQANYQPKPWENTETEPS